ncbi:MAG: ABC transporter ATP-binding protein [Planctomycetes bacterium]|nr:ABC transporter ATP-binding protein [Planctomycetota bacterium]NOG55683.1 ABC transporter ATP-binding protein [Planctomycetota bacterium]
MTPIVLEGLRKAYGATLAVDDVSLRIEAGELFFLLGPSGCGKTTLLRMIAGFVTPTKGRIRLGDVDVTDLPPEKRETGMVFQNYALWPHMSVFDNVAFGLTVRKVSRSQRSERVLEALRIVRMAEYADRKPNELSGGQQQRVALARALVIRPRVLLLDEPLSNLDAKLRMEMRSEIRRICKQTGITTVYVTHDQKEALSMADSVAVLRNGLVVQIGGPREIYDRPTNRFVADFLGETNFVSAEVKNADAGRLVLETPAGLIESRVFNETTPRSGNVTCSIRPEAWCLIGSASSRHSAAPSQVAVGAATSGSGSSSTSSAAAHDRQPEQLPSGKNGMVNQWRGRLLETVYLGEMAQHVIELPGELQVRVFELNPGHIEAGSEVIVGVSPTDVVVLND